MRTWLRAFAVRLRNKKRIPMAIAGRGWCSRAPLEAGVYAIWSKGPDGEPIYVGETSNLRERFNDLRKSVNHTFRRKLKKKLDARRKQPLTEAELTAYMNRNFELSWIAVRLGRAEIEEYLICAWDTGEFNDAPARYMRSRWYAVHHALANRGLD